MSNRTKGPNESETRIEAKRPVKVVKSRIKILIKKRTDVSVNAERLSIVWVEADCAQRMLLRRLQSLTNVRSPALSDVEHLPVRSPSCRHGIVRIHFHRLRNQLTGFV